jgi:membrane protein implicated in regulation of membrane protease activity
MHQFFLYCAVGGAVLFVVQIVLSLLGAGDADADFGPDHAATGHTSADTAFKILSIQGLTAFFAMFGLVGLALLDETGTSAPLALAGGAVGGTLTTFVIARIFRAAKKLEVSGTLDMQKAVGETGTVYLRIAPDKPGKVTVSVSGRLLTLDAVCSAETLDTGTEIVVERVLSDGSLSVVRLPKT